MNIVILDNSLDGGDTWKPIIPFIYNHAIIHEVNTETQCIDLLREHKEIDLILLYAELDSPRKIEIIKHLRIQTKDVAIVMFIHTEDKSRIQTAVCAGLSSYILIPFDCDTVIKTIEYTMKKRHFIQQA